ncbi:MAG: PQQ-like beta-propeller repeat protein [Acidobacteriota bacterium]|nr:PQQ-like beta-propeller repeat protein [Acidobacteriota bacterium]
MTEGRTVTSRILIALSVLLPPVGLVLVWARSGWRTRNRLLASLALLALTWVYVFQVVGLSIERDGTGWRPLVSISPVWSRYATAEGASASGGAHAAPASDVRSWTGFRGSDRDSRYLEGEIRTVWPNDGLPLLWRRPVGGGYASIVAGSGLLFTIEQRGPQEVVAAYDPDNGAEIWTHGWDAEFQETMGGDGPRATPQWHDGRLYVLGATGEFRCFDAASGKVQWGLNILSDNGARNLVWGMSASPLIAGDQVILLPGGPSDRSVVAYHRLTGKFLWGALSDKQAYAAPVVAELAGREQLLVVTAERVVGLDLAGGELHWEYPWVTSYDVNSVEPLLLGDDRLFISSGYGHGAAVLEIGRGEDGYTVKTVWKNKRMKNKFNGSVLHEGHVYGLDDAILACVDVTTGERKWKGGRYGYGQILLASGHLVVLTERGDLVLVEANAEEHRELARFSALTGKTWNYPVIVGGRLLVRNQTQMACFDVSPIPKDPS